MRSFHPTIEGYTAEARTISTALTPWYKPW